jgi:hypothetical protein
MSYHSVEGAFWDALTGKKPVESTTTADPEFDEAVARKDAELAAAKAAGLSRIPDTSASFSGELKSQGPNLLLWGGVAAVVAVLVLSRKK